MLAAQNAGAAAALIYDNQLGSYFVLAAEGSAAASVRIPAAGVPRRVGTQLYDTAASGRAVSLAFAATKPPGPAESFNNLASYSSQGE